MVHYQDFHAMNSEVLMAAYGASPSIQTGFSEVKKYVEGCEKRFTCGLEESELAKLNKSSGTWFHASEDLFKLLIDADFFYDQTKGVFNPVVYEPMSVGMFAGGGEDSGGQQTETVTECKKVVIPGFQDIKFDRNTRSVRLPAGMQLNLDEIIRGWTAEKAVTRLILYSDACAVSIGGVLYAIGLPENKNGWQVGIDNPLFPHQPKTMVHINSRYAVSTDTWEQNRLDGWQSIGARAEINPYSYFRSDWLSVTVIAHNAATAEIFARLLRHASTQQTKLMAAQNNQIAVLAFDQNGKLWGSQNSKGFLTEW